MKTERNILIAFILNLAFAVFEFVGGIFTGSVAIISDSIHDMGDTVSIGVSYILEKKSKKQPDDKHTYGYAGYSVIGGAITTLILIFASVAVIINAIGRIINPTEIDYNGIIIFAIIGVTVNSCAAFVTRKGGSLNQKAVSLHMLEDVLGWIVILVGGIIMRFTDLALIDPIMSVGVAVFILISAVLNLRGIIHIILAGTPDGIDIAEIKEHISELCEVVDVHHIHIWSIDGQNNYATMHVVTNSDSKVIKEQIRNELQSHGIQHITLELETKDEACNEKNCSTKVTTSKHYHLHKGHGH